VHERQAVLRFDRQYLVDVEKERPFEAPRSA